MFMRLVGAAAVGLAVLASRPAAQPVRSAQWTEASVPFRVGETLTYDVTLSSYVVAGTAVTTVQGKQPSSSVPAAYHIVAEGRPVAMLARLYTLYYKMETFLDSVTLLPNRMSLISEEGAKRRVGRTNFDRVRRKASFELESETAARYDFDVPQQVQDGLSAVYVLRTMNFRTGDRITLPVTDEGNVYTVQAEVAGREHVSVPLGALDAWSLKIAIVDAKGQPAASNAGVWISTDARHLPLKLQADLALGSFVLLLRQAE